MTVARSNTPEHGWSGALGAMLSHLRHLTHSLRRDPTPTARNWQDEQSMPVGWWKAL